MSISKRAVIKANKRFLRAYVAVRAGVAGAEEELAEAVMDENFDPAADGIAKGTINMESSDAETPDELEDLDDDVTEIDDDDFEEEADSVVDIESEFDLEASFEDEEDEDDDDDDFDSEFEDDTDDDEEGDGDDFVFEDEPEKKASIPASVARVVNLKRIKY